MADEDLVAKALEHAPALGIAWFIGKPMVDKLLGPTAEYLGKASADLVQKGAENVGRVFQNAVKKSGDRLDQPGQVPPKVLKSIMDDAPYNDNLLAADYYGGVLASSRSGVSRDDRGASFSQLVGSMSNYQIRAHYIFYFTFLRIANGSKKNIAMETEMSTFQISMNIADFINAMGFESDEDINSILTHIFNGLITKNLIKEKYGYGLSADLKDIFPTLLDEGFKLVFVPCSFGVELFLWAQGHGNIPPHLFLTCSLPFLEMEDIHLPQDAILI